jgi:hypothetical protein
MTMAEVRDEAEAKLRMAADMSPDELYAGGVGGWWLLAAGWSRRHGEG